MDAPSGQLTAVPTTTTPSPPEPPEPDERLATTQAFRRFAAHVSVCAGRWLTGLGVSDADRDDVLQEVLLQMYQRRESYDPALGRWKAWAFGFVGRAVLNYHKRRGNRIKRVDVARDVLPDIATSSPSPEEKTEAVMMQALLEKCLANLDVDSRAILHAKAEGIEMPDIAAALGLSLSAAYARLNAARTRLQAALDREQRRKLSLGVAVIPLSIDQLLASDTAIVHFSTETMRRVWKTLDRVMAADVAAGRLGDDGTEVPRYMGSPDVAPRARLAARILRALGPRVRSALTHVAAAAIGAVATYAPLGHDSTHADARTASSLVAGVEDSRNLAPTGTAAPSTARSSGAVERTDAGSGPHTAGRDIIAGEQALIDFGTTAYQSGKYEVAIKVLREHANKYPRGQFSDAREKLFILALLRSGQKLEARQRIEWLRQASPGSPLLAELDAAMNVNDP